MKEFNYDSYMRHNPLMKEADENQDASIELEFATAEKKPDFQKDLKVYGIKVEPSGDKKKKYSGQKDELRNFVTKYWGLATSKSIDETSGYGNYTKPETMLELEDEDADIPSADTVYFNVIQYVKDQINSEELSMDEVQTLREKLAAFFKQ